MTDERIAEGGWDENARREIGVLENGQAIAVSEGVGIQEGEEVGLIVSGMFPVLDGGRQARVEGVGEGL